MMDAPSEPPRVVVTPVTLGGGGLQNPPFMSPHMAGGAVQRPFSPAEGEVGFSLTETGKKKRGRPRKYGPDGNVSLALSSGPSSGGLQSSGAAGKKRGRPVGGGKKQQLDALGAAGVGFTPHVITVKAGEDVAAKIMSFSQQGTRTVCILTATGAVSNVTLRQPAASGGTITHEGRFEILSLAGSFMLTESGGTRSRSGGLSVSLAGMNGDVVGGGVAGMLLAAAPVQVILGSFISEIKKPDLELVRHDLASPTLQISPIGFAVAPSPPSQGTSSESSDEDGSPIDQTHRLSYSTSQAMPQMSGYPHVAWMGGAHFANQHRPEQK